MKLKVATILLIILSYSGCTYDVYNPDICFQENILPIFISNCTMSGCHGPTAPEGEYDLSNYEGIMRGIVPGHPLRSEIYNAIRGNNPSMPMGGKLDDIDVTYIKIWIKMGAPNSSNCNHCDTSQYSYSGRIEPLMNTWCVGCHNSGSAAAGYDLSNYNGVAAAIHDNRLIGSLEHLSGYVPMPMNARKLSDCDRSAVAKWVSSGYPNN